MHEEAAAVGASMKRVEHLDDYALGLMPDALAESFEEELFAAAAKGEDEDDRWYDRIRRLIDYVAQSGILVRGSTAEDLEDLRSAGLRVHVADVGTGGTAEWPRPQGDVDLIVTHVRCDIRGWESVNIDVERPDGTHLHTFRDVLPDPTSGNLYAVCAPPLAMMSYGGNRLISRITGVRRGAKEREVIAVYDTTPA